MWIYTQSTGKLSRSGVVVATGYSGIGAGKNNPAMQNVPDVGPIPQGIYAIGAQFDSSTHGPHAMPLTPDPGNQMFGRAEFMVHGDSIEHPGQASHGCIIMPRPIRDQIAASGDNQLTVVA